MSDNFSYQVFCTSGAALLRTFDEAFDELSFPTYQIPLFQWLEWRVVFDPAPMGQVRPAARTPEQLLRSAEAYCVWRAGLSWRPTSDRFDPDRVAYLEAAGILRDVPFREVGPQLTLPPLTAPLEISLERRPRAQLVKELLRADRRLTDAKLLSHLPPKKLAKMLAAAPGRQIEKRRA